MQSDLDTVSHCAKLMQLTLAAPKGKILTINKMRSQSQSSLHIQDDILVEVSEMEDLGITADDRLNFDLRCVSKIKQTCKVIKFVFRNFKTVDAPSTSTVQNLRCSDFGLWLYHLQPLHH